MAQKKFFHRRSRKARHSERIRPQKRQAIQSLENSILGFLFTQKEPVTIAEVARAITGKRTLSGDLKIAMAQLVRNKLIKKPGKKHYTLAQSAKLYPGHLQQHPRGFGFVAIDAGSVKEFTRDIFISAGKMGGAVHGDRVLVRVLEVSSKNRAEGVIISIIEKGPGTVAGFIKKEKKTTFVYPEDPRYPFIIKVQPEAAEDLEQGTAVIATFTPPEKSSRVIHGSILEVLGSPDSIDVQMRLVIEKFNLPHDFSEQTVTEASALSEELPPATGREDLREMQLVTIDGETAKDFDDAVCVLKTEKGYRLYVAIADVSHYVQPGSAIDKDAYERGTSIYFPGRVIPMLPEKLSNNLCSLIPETDRLAVTAILDFDTEGKRIGKKYCRSIIRSKKRFTYTLVSEILLARDKQAREENREFIEMLESAEELARLLLQRRLDRGSIGFSLPEPEIDLEESGKISTIRRSKRDFSHQIIEEFMLAANEAVAETFTRGNRKSLYRIHELPEYEKVMEFSEFAKTLDLQLPPPEVSPEWFGKVLGMCKGTPTEYVVNNLLLRTMQQARYSANNVGHFALAAADYTHFTSPIRRYPDLLVHRELVTLLNKSSSDETQQAKATAIEEKGIFLSSRERTAVSAERDMAERLKLIYMEKHLNEPFTAIISGVTDFALFVELTDLFISGSIGLENLGNEYYLFDEKHHRVIGEISRTIFQLGDQITVCATEIDKNKNRVYFTPCSMK